MLDKKRISCLKNLERLIHYNFRDKKLLNQALAHRSYAYEHPREKILDNERLEFLGDAILGLVVGDYIYRRFPDHQEGKMTQMRSALVSRSALENLAERIKLGELILFGRGETASGGAEQPRNLSGAYEAIIGAVYVDGGFKRAARFIESQFDVEFKKISENGARRDYKSILQEYTLRRYKNLPRYTVMLEEGPAHKKHFEIAVSVGGEARAVGAGKNKKSAQQDAAYKALLNMGLLDKSDKEK
ncbi:MAG: ribonuclease III [Candidatus Omnitrophota bacterium]